MNLPARCDMNGLASLLCTALLASGCASFNGRNLIPGKSVAADVRAEMGEPAEQIKITDGEFLWFYLRQPYGRQTFAVRFGADGVVRGVEQRLTVENVNKISPGTSQAAVRELLGPPWRVTNLARLQREVWEYAIYNKSASLEEYFLYVQFSGGAVREVLMLRDVYFDPGGAKG